VAGWGGEGRSVDGWLVRRIWLGGGERDGWWIACMDFGAGSIAFTWGEKTSYSNSSNHLPLPNPQPKLSPHLTPSPTSTHSPPSSSPPPAIPHHPSPPAPDSHPYSPGPSDSSAARCCLSSARQPPFPASDPGLRLLCGGAGRRGRRGGIRFRRRGRGGGGPRCRCL